MRRPKATGRSQHAGGSGRAWIWLRSYPACVADHTPDGPDQVPKRERRPPAGTALNSKHSPKVTTPMASPSYMKTPYSVTPCGHPGAVRKTAAISEAGSRPLSAGFGRRYRVKPNLIPLIAELAGLAGIGGER